MPLGHQPAEAGTPPNTLAPRAELAQPDSARWTLAGVLAGATAIIAITAMAEFVGRLVPVVGAPVCAILLGVATRSLAAPDASAQRVISFSSKRLLQAAIVLLGATLSLGEVARVGRASLPIMLTTVVVVLALSLILGRALGIQGRLRTLIGVGTAICGASAIGAVSGVIAATEVEISYAISTIFVFNVAAVLLFPAIGHLMSLGQHPFGLWAGTSVNDTSSVVATAYSYGNAAGNYAVVVKLTRTTLIIPIVFILAAVQLIAQREDRTPKIRSVFPWFIVLFVGAAALGSIGLVSPGLRRALANAGVLLITAALAAVGLSTRFDAIRRTGVRPLLLGAILWLVIGSLGLLLANDMLV
jgi:uncharacterized integral membrane protein (TIGR00698 family)